ncbi:MAG TPA: hypothetical protein VF590_04640 [Isosphaeraceae bacterium]
MQTLAEAIRADPHWSPVIPCKDQAGNPLTAGYDLVDGSGQGFKAGQAIYTYGLSDPVLRAAGPAAGRARRTAADDLRLRNKLWSPTPGTTTLVRDGGTPAPRTLGSSPRPGAAGPAFKWTVSDLTTHHGVRVDSTSIRVDDADNFSINASNVYLRTLYAGYQLFDDAGKTQGDEQTLRSISAVNSLLGIPMPTDPAALAFKMNGAASVRLLFGSLGTTDWDAIVSTRGALLTGLWQYGIPLVFMAVGKAFTSSSAFNKIVNDPDLVKAALGWALPNIGGGLVVASAATNTKKVLFSFGDVVLGIVLAKGMEELGKWLIEQAGSEALSAAFGPVGWAFRIAAVGVDFENMAITTGEVLSSPACITVTVSRALDVALTLHPDPRHGEAGKPETAVWPAVATHYVATLQPRHGTAKTLKGQLPATTGNTPLPLRFQDVPAGGEFRILVGLYSANDWLAGSRQGDWTQARPNQGTTLQLGDKSITETLVPLAPDSQYVFKEKVADRAGAFVWQAGSTPPVATRSSLDCGGNATLCELVGLTINNSAFQVGYAWRASGQHLSPDAPAAPASDAQLYAVQNLSVLAEPGSRLKATGLGFTGRPAIAYAPSTAAKDQIDPANFVLDPRGGGMHLRRVVLDDGQRDFGLGNPDLKSWGRFPLENVDALAVHPNNAVIACSWQDHKMMILNPPPAPVPDDQAPVALMVSGKGSRQGLMQGPKALAVAPDGRILVLETVNRRVQAFDTKGNPVPSFTPFPALFTLGTAQVAADLDAGRVPETFLRSTAALPLFTLAPAFAAQLDAARFQPRNDPLILELSRQGVILGYDPDHMDDPKQSAQISVLDKGRSWVISDPRGMAWVVLAQDQGLAVFHRPTGVEVRVEAPGRQWLLVEHATGDAWKLTASPAAPDQTEVRSSLSFFPLRGDAAGALTYLDMAVEAQGYVYVLSYRGDGSQATDYLLDVYGPDGGFCFRTPDPSLTTAPQNVVAGRIAVDVWRDLYALTFEAMRGPGGGPQPGLAHWIPTPPLFDLPLSNQPDLN